MTGLKVLKDNNFIELEDKVDIREKSLILQTLKSDVQFLASKNLMDYSLLLI
jgi:hypothetical protein